MDSIRKHLYGNIPLGWALTLWLLSWKWKRLWYRKNLL